MEEKETQPTKTLEEHQQLAEKAREWRSKGGILHHLIVSEPGFREFFYDEIVKKGIPVSAFIGRMREKFPKLPEEYYPGETTIYNYKKKMKRDLGDEKIGLAMKNELRILETMSGFNYFEERKAIYDKTCMAIDIAEKAVAYNVDMMERLKLPPQTLWEALLKLKDLLAARSSHLEELDKLSVRFGLMPAREERNIIFAQQNNTLVVNDEQSDVMGKIGLSAKDFEDGNLEKTMQKVMGFYTKKYGIGDQKLTDGGNVIEGVPVSQPITADQPTEGTGGNITDGKN